MRFLDWLVLVGYAVGMLAIGKYYARSNKTTDDYMLDGRTMSPIAIGLSLFATLTNALSYLAVPGVMVKHGPLVLSLILVFPLIGIEDGWWLIPLFMREQVASACVVEHDSWG